jgi:hypothetical protein
MTNKSLVAVVALLGALAGATLARSYAGACSCATPGWDLNLAHSTEPDDSIWPEGATLQTTSWGPITIQSFAWLDAKVDFVQGTL